MTAESVATTATNATVFNGESAGFEGGGRGSRYGGGAEEIVTGFIRGWWSALFSSIRYVVFPVPVVPTSAAFGYFVW